MKLNKYLLGLLFAPALLFVGCSDYVDTEMESPLADETASGANFSAASTPVVVDPDKTSFDLTLNRVNTTGAITVPVTVVSCDEVSTGVKFCDQPAAFSFAAGESTAKITLNVNPECKFQETYKMSLKIGDQKDHIYAAGTSATTVSFSKDYKWITLGQPVISEKGWHAGGILAPVEWASDFKDDSGKMLFRLKALYGYAGKTSNTSMGHIQFYLDEKYAPAGLFSINGYDPTNIDTGVLYIAEDEQTETTDEIYYYMNVTEITGGEYTTDEDDEEKETLVPYLFKYKVFYKDNTTNLEVEAKLDFDIKSKTEAAKKKLEEELKVY